MNKHAEKRTRRLQPGGRAARCACSLPAGFTLVELLVVCALIGIVIALVFPVMSSSIEHARSARCKSNLRTLFMANEYYAADHGHYVAAASDIMGSNLERWHGRRGSASEPFEGRDGPLAPYLPGEDAVRACPSFSAAGGRFGGDGFERSCGGYGYNAVGVGSRTYPQGYAQHALQRGMRPSEIGNPAQVVMFADAAFPQPYGSDPTHLIEYSFIEPYHWVFEPWTESGARADPSIHFRHRGYANVVWCDGHITSERLETEAQQWFTDKRIGWFGPPDNTHFAPRP